MYIETVSISYFSEKKHNMGIRTGAMKCLGRTLHTYSKYNF